MSELTNERVGEWVNDWINEWMSEWVSEWVNERTDGWMNAWMHEWMKVDIQCTETKVNTTYIDIAGFGFRVSMLILSVKCVKKIKFQWSFVLHIINELYYTYIWLFVLFSKKTFLKYENN